MSNKIADLTDSLRYKKEYSQIARDALVVIDHQAEEIERLKKENFEWKRTYDKLLLEANRNVNP
jgi:hypothetical protein